jgi:predicted O-methyltransferase YrrM
MTAPRHLFACLVHERPDCVADLVANLRRFDPASEVLLYNGGRDGALLAGRFDAHVHPRPRVLQRGRLHEFALDCVEYGLEAIGFDAMTIVDSDQLLVRQGWSEAVAARIGGAGMLTATPARQPPDTPLWTPRAAYAERALWEPLLAGLPRGQEAFGHWTFWPATVFSAEAGAAVAERLRRDRELAVMLERTAIWATEEVVLPMLVHALGYDIAASPDAGEYVRYRVRFVARDLDAARSREDVYWMHPVPRRIDHPLRRRIRSAAPARAPADAPLLLTQPILRRMQAVEGWLTEEEADLLIAATARAAGSHPDAAIVEVGSWCGRSTTVIASVLEALRSRAKLHAVDPHDGVVSVAGGGHTRRQPTLPRFKANLARAGLRDRVVVVRRRATEVQWDGPISLLLVDHLHDRASVTADHERFAPHVVPGGYVAFHDYARYWPDVVDFVDGLLAVGGWERLQQAGSLVVLRKLAGVRAAAGPELISCVMPTGGRPELAAESIACFLAQDHPAAELIVVDDGADPVEPPDDPRIRVLAVEPGLTIGAKRNLAIRAAAGQLIAHWDDDDWYAPWRLSAQLRELRARGADVCGLRSLLYYESATGRGWRYVWPATSGTWLHDATLMYTRELWERQNQPDANHGLDTRLLWGGVAKRIATLDDESLYVGTIHAGNTSPKHTDHRYWTPLPDGTLPALMGDAFARLRGPFALASTR